MDTIEIENKILCINNLERKEELLGLSEDSKPTYLNLEHYSKIREDNMEFAKIDYDEIFKYIMTSFKYDNFLNLDGKLILTSMLIMYMPVWIEKEDFYEEECHLSMMDWIYKLRSELEKDLDERVFHLLYNIIIIFGNIPIKVDDLLDFKIYQKFNKIRKLIQNKKLIYYEPLDRLLNHWNFFVNNNFNSTDFFLKRKRDKRESNFFYEDENLNFKKVRIILLFYIINFIFSLNIILNNNFLIFRHAKIVKRMKKILNIRS